MPEIEKSEPKKLIQLSVIKNRRAEEALTSLRADLKSVMETALKAPDMEGYVVIIMRENGESDVNYASGSMKPGWLPAYVQDQLSIAINETRETEDVI